MSVLDIPRTLVMIRGAGDIGSGIARRLFLAGFPVVMTELSEPLCIRRTVAFSDAVFEGKALVEGVESRLAGMDALAGWDFRRSIPLVVDPAGETVRHIRPRVLVDARLLKGAAD